MRRFSLAHWPTRPSPSAYCLERCLRSSYPYPAWKPSTCSPPETPGRIVYRTPCCASTSGASSERIMLETVDRSRWPWSNRVNRSRLVFSRCCAVLRRVLQDPSPAACLDPNLPGEVALGHRRRHISDGTYLVGEIRRQLVHVVGE